MLRFVRHPAPAALLCGLLGCAIAPELSAATSDGQRAASPAESSQNTAPATTPAKLYIREFRVLGARELPKIDIEETVYPFLGPGRTADDVEQARAALERAYQAKGFQGASVQAPPQQGRGGIVYLQVSAGTVGQLRVKGSRYFLPSAIKQRAQSLAEGKALNFNDVTHDIVALNQFPDRQITPELRPGAEPGTLDVDLIVKDKFPLHGAVELNNRYTANTQPLRLNVSLNYNNLWQLGHTLGASYQVAPQRRADTEIISGYYIARFAGAESFSLMLQGRKQDSNISIAGPGGGSVSTSNRVVAPGESYGIRGILTLPPLKDFYHSFTFGVDYGHFENEVTVAGADGTIVTISSPFTYYPVTASYSATWASKSYTTDLNAGVTLGIRGVGSRRRDFENSRFGADANFIKLRGDLSHAHDLPGGWEGFVKIEGQVANEPLVNTEQIGGGGLNSIRGYLESEVLADNGVFGTLELRSPSLLSFLGKDEKQREANEWRIYGFFDAGAFGLRDALPEQDDSFTLASYGIGTRLRLLGHLNGSLDAAIPIFSQVNTKARDARLTFRVWADF